MLKKKVRGTWNKKDKIKIAGRSHSQGCLRKLPKLFIIQALDMKLPRLLYSTRKRTILKQTGMEIKR